MDLLKKYQCVRTDNDNKFSDSSESSSLLFCNMITFSIKYQQRIKSCSFWHSLLFINFFCDFLLLDCDFLFLTFDSDKSTQMVWFLDCFYFSCLKGQCHEIFNLFFALKTLPGPHMNKLKWFRELFRFCEDIYLQGSKFACPHSQRETILPVHMGPKRVENLVTLSLFWIMGSTKINMLFLSINTYSYCM